MIIRCLTTCCLKLT